MPVVFRKFNESQPREPAGSPAGGQFAAMQARGFAGQSPGQLLDESNPHHRALGDAYRAGLRAAHLASQSTLGGTLTPAQVHQFEAATHEDKKSVVSGRELRAVTDFVGGKPVGHSRRYARMRQQTEGFKNDQARAKFSPSSF